MRIGRPPKEETPYKIIIHKNGGKRYASTKVVISETEGKKVYRHKHWGSIDENNVFHPNRLYLMTEEEERDKLIFPSEMDMSEAERIILERDQTKAKTKSKTKISQDFILPTKTLLYGDVWLLEQIAKDSGVDKDILTTFNGNREIADKVLTIAIYLICEDQHLHRLASWQRIEKTPTPYSISMDEINTLIRSITAEHLSNLIEQRQIRIRVAGFGSIGISNNVLIENLSNALEESSCNQNMEGLVNNLYARLLLYYTQQLLLGNIHYIWDTTPLKNLYHSPIDILDEMRSIQYMEYEGYPSEITPLSNEQLEICRIFKFEPPVVR